MSDSELTTNAMDRPTIDTGAYRETMGLFATGVTVILAGQDNDIRGMTANCVTSLSLEPILIIVCPSKKSHLSSYLKKGRHFTLNILGERQEAIANYFACGSSQTATPEFEFVTWPAAGSVPRLRDCPGAVACQVFDIHDGGDHWIVVGEVVGVHRGPAPHRPLLFFGGSYHSPARKEPEHLEPSSGPYE
ncbi:MAG: flavin reductase family protein [Gammaproteobacteria bacterium]|nr:MAG: flavin reductase family protein [Gammaproteobacteria bacterium]